MRRVRRVQIVYARCAPFDTAERGIGTVRIARTRAGGPSRPGPEVIVHRARSMAASAASVRLTRSSPLSSGFSLEKAVCKIRCASSNSDLIFLWSSAVMCEIIDRNFSKVKCKARNDAKLSPGTAIKKPKSAERKAIPIPLTLLTGAGLCLIESMKRT